VQTKKKSQWSKFLVGFIFFLFLGAFLIDGTFRSQDELSTIEEVPVGFNDHQKWRDVGTPTGLGGLMDSGYTKSVKFTKEDITILGRKDPFLSGASNFGPTTLFGPDDSALEATYRVPYAPSKSLHLDFPKVCNNGEIVGTNAAITSCSMIVGTSPKNAEEWRAYHDEGYVVTYNTVDNTYDPNSNGGGYINWVKRPVSQGFVEGGPWHYRPYLPDLVNDLKNDEYIEVNHQLSWIYYDHYTWEPKVGMDNYQVWFWGLRCNNGQWERMIYHFVYPNPTLG